MLQIFFFIIGFLMLVYGMSIIVIYLNLITIGYNLCDYVNFIISRYECYLCVIGLFIIIFIMYGERGNK